MTNNPSDNDLVAAFLANKGATVIPQSSRDGSSSSVCYINSAQTVLQHTGKAYKGLLSVFDVTNKRQLNVSCKREFMDDIKVGGTFNLSLKYVGDAPKGIDYRVSQTPTETETSSTLHKVPGIDVL